MGKGLNTAGKIVAWVLAILLLAGVAGVIRPGQKSVQVIVGTKVQFVADEFKKVCK